MPITKHTCPWQASPATGRYANRYVELKKEKNEPRFQ